MDGRERVAAKGKCDSALGTGPHWEVASVPPLGRDGGPQGHGEQSGMPPVPRTCSLLTRRSRSVMSFETNLLKAYGKITERMTVCV